MKFEQPNHNHESNANTEKEEIPEELIENTRTKLEAGKINTPITLSELEELAEGDPNSEKALEELLSYATRYAADVWSMKELLANRSEYSTEEWKEKYDKADKDRSRLHNALIDSIAILSRSLKAADRDISWISKLAPTGKLERPACGSFAIMLTYMQYVNSENSD